MTIETKYGIGKIIYFLHNNRALNSVVRMIKIEVISLLPDDTYDIEITYLCSSEPDEKRVFAKVSEKDAYLSKELLLKSL